MGARPAREIWEAALGELQIQVNKPNYRTWLEKTQGLSYQNNEFIIGVPNAFVAEYLDKNQRSLMERTLSNILHRGVRAIFIVNQETRNVKATTAARQEIVTAPAASLRLSPKYTFDSFVVGDCNRLAHAAALEVAQNPGKSYNPLFIYGGAGLGKTHLLQAIGHGAISSGKKVIYVSGEEFTNEFISSVQGKRMDSFRSRYRGCDFLLIDDIQFISGKEQTEECFFHTFNELHNASRQIVMTCDKSPGEIPVLSDRLRSRFSWGLAADMLPPNAGTRRAILELKAGKEGADLTPDILDLMAEQALKNIRELEGSLNRIVAYARLLKTSLTRELAISALTDIARRGNGAMSPAEIIEAVAGSFKLLPEDLIGRKRDKDTALARELAMYIIRREKGYSLAEIGRQLGGRNPSTVSHACSRIEDELPDSPYLKQKLTGITNTIKTRHHC